MSLQATSLLAGLFVLLMVPLSLQVTLRRVKTENASPDGGDDEILQRRIRAHGNFTEYAPLALMCVALIEYSGAARTLAWGLAAAFLVGRILHAICMLYMPTSKLRGLAMLIQHAAFLVAGFWLLLHAQ